MDPLVSYVPPVRRSARTRAFVTAAVVGTLAAALLVWLAVRFASENPDQASLGSNVLRLQAERLSRAIERDGPILFKDPLNRGREVYVQHVGDEVDEGWLAISAYAGEPDVDCLLRWDRDDEVFVDPCTDRTYPADGTGLVTYPAEVEGRAVEVDLRSPRPAG